MAGVGKAGGPTPQQIEAMVTRANTAPQQTKPAPVQGGEAPPVGQQTKPAPVHGGEAPPAGEQTQVTKPWSKSVAATEGGEPPPASEKQASEPWSKKTTQALESWSKAIDATMDKIRNTKG